MGVDWGKLLPVIIGAGGSIAGGLLGSKAQSGAVQASKEDLAKARDIANQLLGKAYPQAMDTAKWGMEQGQANTDWAFKNALDLLKQAYLGSNDQLTTGFKNAGTARTSGMMQGRSDVQSGLLQALLAAKQGTGSAYSMLAPYSGLGTNAVGKLNSLFGGGGKIPVGATSGGNVTLRGMPGFPMLASPSYDAMPTSGLGNVNITSMPKLTMPKVTNPTAAGLYNYVGTADGSDIASAENAVGGFGGNKLATGLGSTGIGMLTGLGAGPIGMGVGALAGYLINKFTSLGRNKEASSAGMDSASDYIWKTLYPQYEAGQITADQFKQMGNEKLAQWEKTLPGNVRQKSVEDQLWWLNQDPNSNTLKYKLPFTWDIPGYTAVRHA